jgi:polyhydroxybutyrate depolymerase
MGHALDGVLVAGGRERTYRLHLPPAYDGQRSLPLVLVLHGGGGTAQGVADISGFSAKADKEGFIVVYPNGTGRHPDRLFTWNAANCCGYAHEHNVDDVGFIRALLDKLEAELSIDPKRVFVTGISNGGMMAYRLACELSDRIAAIAPVAGSLNGTACAPAGPVSVIIFHGTADKNVLYGGGVPKKGVDRRLRVDKPVSYAVSFWVNHDGCASVPRREEQGRVVRESYEGGRDGTSVVLYTIRDEGHTWPGGKAWAFWADRPTHEISATDAMWDFFMKHPKP